jgi:hypothetical protein
MLWIECIEAVQFLDHFRVNPLRVAILWTAMDYAMSDRSQCIATLLDPIHE